MLDQVSPNGYYYQLAGWLQARISDPGFVFRDANNDIMNPKPQLSTLQNPDLFEPQWAEDLFLAHPERCHYLNCELDKASANYDRKMGLIKDWNEARSSGYINPLAMSIVEGFQDSIANHVSYTGAMQDPFFAVGGRGNVQRSNLLSLLKQYKNETTDSKDYNNDGDNADGWVSLWVYSNYKGLYNNKYPNASQRWNTFKGLYMGEKQKRNILITDGPCDYQNPDNDFTVVKKPELSEDKDVINNKNLESVAMMCDKSCEENAEIWMNMFKGKCSIATWQGNDYITIKNYLKKYCSEKCGFANPFALVISEDTLSNSDLNSARLLLLNNYGCRMSAISVSDNIYAKGTSTHTICEVKIEDKEYLKAINRLIASLSGSSSNSINPSLIYNLSNFDLGTYANTCNPNIRLTNSYVSTGNGIILSYTFPSKPGGGQYTINDLKKFDNWYIPSIGNVISIDFVFFDGNRFNYITSRNSFNFCLHDVGICTTTNIVEGISTTGNNLFSVTPNYTAIKDECMAELTREATYNATVVWNEEVNKYLNTYLTGHFNKCFDDPFIEDFYYISNEPRQYHYTLYYYDQAGNLVQTVPPAGAELLGVGSFDTKGKYNGTTQPSHRLKTRYKYNSLNQLIWQTSPDGGNSNFYYNDKGQMRLSQNAKQKAASSGVNQKYSYTRYDLQGRVVEVGQLENFAIDFGAGLAGVDSVAMYDPSKAAAISAVINNPGFPSASSSTLTYITQTIYDEAYPGLGAVTQQNLRGRVSASIYMPTETTTESTTGYSYDIHGNVQKLYQIVSGLPTKTVDYEYDLISGNVNKVFYQKGQSDQFSHAYTYDADNRIRSAKTSSDGIIWEEDAHYFYYKHGPLARTELGEDKLQGTDYIYTLQGWLKNINTPHAQTTSTGIHLNNLDPSKDGLNTSNNINQFVGQDDYMMSLAYYQGDYKAIGTAPLGSGNSGIWASEPGTLMVLGPQNKKGLFNENISMMVNDTRNFMDVPFPGTGTSDRLMAYRYDQLNRIKNGYSFNSFSSGSGWASRSLGPLVKYDTEFEYDPNGNIGKLVRIGNNNDLMDNLSYRYNKDANDKLINNKLRSVTENAPPSAYTDDMEHHSSADNYEYDAIGNLTKDIKEGVTNIKWNVYGKVEEVIRSGANSDLHFDYDAQGNRVKKTVVVKNPDGSWLTNTCTYYVRDASGNVLATYESDYETGDYFLKDFTIYGSDRLGTKKVDKLLVFDHSDLVAIGSVQDSRVKDAYVDSGSPTSTFGANTLLSASSGTSVKRMFVDFIERGYIPKGSTIITAALVLKGNAATPHNQTSGSNACYARRITAAWDESTVTWNNQPAATSAFQVSVPAVLGTGYTSIDITGLMQLMVNDPDNSHGIELLLQTESGTRAMNFFSSEAANAADRPRMYVYYREPSRAMRTLGKKNYELKDHLGNVRAIISDVKTGRDIAGVDNKADLYTTRVTGFHDYGPFGELLPGRQLTGSGYRYGFNGKEKDDEFHGNYDYGFRIYDPRIAKFLSVDPLTKAYPELTPYQFASNSPVAGIDLDGLELKVIIDEKYKGDANVLKLVNAIQTGTFWLVYSNPEKGEVDRRYGGNLRNSPIYNFFLDNYDKFKIMYNSKIEGVEILIGEKIIYTNPANNKDNQEYTFFVDCIIDMKDVIWNSPAGKGVSKLEDHTEEENKAGVINEAAGHEFKLDQLSPYVPTKENKDRAVVQPITTDSPVELEKNSAHDVFKKYGEFVGDEMLKQEEAPTKGHNYNQER